MSLQNKRIVLCRRPEQAREMVLALQHQKAWPIVFSTFSVQPLGLSIENSARIENLNNFSWLILGSSNGVGFFVNLLDILNVTFPVTAPPQVAVVGEKTAKAWKQFFPNAPVSMKADNLQSLLDTLSKAQPELSMAVLNLTSEQSLRNIRIDVPRNIDLVRVPIYETVPEYSHEDSELEFVRSADYDAIYFGSPSSFDYFHEIVGKVPLGKVAVCVSGGTTKAHIEKKGYTVQVVPDRPGTAELIRALERYFN